MDTAKPSRNHRGWLVVLIALVLVAASLVAWNRSLPTLRATPVTLRVAFGKPVKLAWPSRGAAAVGATDFGLLASSGSTKARPMASIAKVILAMAVLDAKPLPLGQQGPTIRITQSDVAIYKKTLAKDGSAVAVFVGEHLSERQALEALLLASANNLADTLAIWSFGSVSGYLAKASSLLVQLGLEDTHVADTSGFSARSVSTPQDLVKLGLAVVGEPVLASLVKEKTAKLPTGTIYNLNTLLGEHRIIGIKTGNTDEAGGCYLFAAAFKTADGQQVTVVGALMGQTNLESALGLAPRLLATTMVGFTTMTVLPAGSVVGVYRVPWGRNVNAVTTENVKLLAWLGHSPAIDVRLEPIRGATASNIGVGEVAIASGGDTQKTDIHLTQAISAPSWAWRATH